MQAMRQWQTRGLWQSGEGRQAVGAATRTVEVQAAGFLAGLARESVGMLVSLWARPAQSWSRRTAARMRCERGAIGARSCSQYAEGCRTHGSALAQRRWRRG